MTLLRRLGEFFGGLIFSLCLGLLVFLIALSNFTQYNTLQPIVTNVIKNQLQENDAVSNLQQQCQNFNLTTVSINTSNEKFDFSCTDIKDNSSTVESLIAIKIFNQTYYKQYSCAFLDCIKGFVFPQNPSDVQSQQSQVIISEKANEFFSSTQIYLIVATIIGLILIIISVRVWYNILKVVGITILLVGIVYLFIPFIKSEVLKLPQIAQQQEFSTIIDTLFALILSLLRDMLVVGIVLTVIGYVSAFLLHHDEKIKEQKANQPM